MFVAKNFATIQSCVFIVPINQVLHDNNMLPVICGRQEAMKSANFVTGSILILPPSLPPTCKNVHTHAHAQKHTIRLSRFDLSPYMVNAAKMYKECQWKAVRRASTVHGTPLFWTP